MDNNKILSDLLVIVITNNLNSILPGFDINYGISYLDNTISINICQYTDYSGKNDKTYSIDLDKEVDISKINKDLHDIVISVAKSK